ncbi:MAG TPA: tellurite resistance TerB family protein [Candidimonas sp.]|nr:tellurite resistance TerB family protein [Candidimonas sp.]
MSVQQLLQQLLQSGQGLAQTASSKVGDSKLGSNLGGFGGGAIAGGVLGLLLGNKKFRKMGGKVGAYGGAAALGALALKAYQDWQSKQGAAAEQGQPTPQPAPQPVLGLPAPGIEQHSKVILSAMIAAAKADGHIGPEEKQLMDSEVVKLSNDPSARAWFDAELAKPADPSQVAALATSPELAAEVYLASLLVVDEESFMERAYLDELARNLKLDPSLKAELESRLKSLA